MKRAIKKQLGKLFACNILKKRQELWQRAVRNFTKYSNIPVPEFKICKGHTCNTNRDVGMFSLQVVQLLWYKRFLCFIYASALPKYGPFLAKDTL